MHSHNLPLVAMLWLPALLALLRRLPGVTPAWRRADPLTQSALLLMAVAAVVHVALIPAHASEPITAILFALDAIGLAVVGSAGLLGLRFWRIAAVALLLGAVGAYAVYIAAGWEAIDATGALTKLAELGAVELLVLGWLVRTQRLRLSRAAAALLGGRGVAAQVRHPG